MVYDDVKKEVKRFILEEFLPKGYDLKDDEFLFDSGIIDSLGMIKLMTFIEKTFDLIINPSEISIDNFNTIEKIARIVSKKAKKNA